RVAGRFRGAHARPLRHRARARALAPLRVRAHALSRARQPARARAGPAAFRQGRVAARGLSEPMANNSIARARPAAAGALRERVGLAGVVMFGAGTAIGVSIFTVL